MGFGRIGTDGITDIYIVDANGGKPVNVTNNKADDSMPAWSPDGGRIAFVHHHNKNSEIYVMPTPAGP